MRPLEVLFVLVILTGVSVDGRNNIRVHVPLACPQPFHFTVEIYEIDYLRLGTDDFWMSTEEISSEDTEQYDAVQQSYTTNFWHCGLDEPRWPHPEYDMAIYVGHNCTTNGEWKCMFSFRTAYIKSRMEVDVWTPQELLDYGEDRKCRYKDYPVPRNARDPLKAIYAEWGKKIN